MSDGMQMASPCFELTGERYDDGKNWILREGHHGWRYQAKPAWKFGRC